MFGSYRINEEKPGATPRLHPGFSKGALNFYTGSVQVITEPLETNRRTFYRTLRQVLYT